MDTGSEPQESLPRLPLDMIVPSYALKRRFGISFCSSSSYLTEPRFERRGAISFERTDKNAIYIRMLGDVKLQGSPDKLAAGKSSPIADADRDMLDKLAISDERRKFRSRFMSVSKGRRQRKSQTKLSREGKSLIDEFYHSPTRLLLSRLGDWNFNIFSLEGLSGGRSLFHVAYHLFQTYDLIRGFQLDSIRLMQFFNLVEQNYHETNPYHNAVHAADVTQSMHCYLQEKEVYESTSDLEKMAALVAALTHDLDHPGVNNTFLIVTSNHLATLYQNISVLENHHWRSAVGLLQETGVLAHLHDQQRESFVQQLQALILATDITRQQEFLLRFCRYIESGEFQYRKNEEHRHFLLQIALKVADISNPCRPWRISQRWSRRICHEFFLQGDMERALNVAVTPLCDRYGNTLANIQHGFMQFVVSPLFKAWDKFLGTDLSAQMMSHLSHNQSQWKSIMDSGQEVSEVDSDTGEGQFEEAKKDVKENPEEKEEFNVKDKEETSGSIEVARTVSIHVNDAEVSQRKVLIEDKYIHSEHEEEEEGRSEEDDVVENDVNLVYHYQNESEESGRGLSPVSEDSEKSIPTVGSIRRFSLPHVMRKDLNFYLGLRKDSNIIPIDMHRRQSLPTTVMFFHSSYGKNSASPSPRSLSMDTLLTRPKISNLSPSLEMSFMRGGLDPFSFTPLKHQTLMLQGGTLTRFVSNPTARRASCGPCLSEHYKITTQSNSDFVIPPFKNRKSSQKHPLTGLSSSWPTMARRSTTNGSTPHHAPPSVSSTQSISNKSSTSFPSDDQFQSQHISTSSVGLNAEEGDNFDPSPASHADTNSPEHHQNSSRHNYPQCLSLSVSSSQDDHNLPRPQ